MNTVFTSRTNFVCKALAISLVGLSAICTTASMADTRYRTPSQQVHILPYPYKPPVQQQLTGAGSTAQPSNAWVQQQAEAQRKANTYYYQPAPPQPFSPQTRYAYPDSSLRSMGYPPVPTQLPPQVINSIPSPSAIGCASGARTGASFGGPVGGTIGCAVGAFGAPTSRKGAASRLFTVEQAY